MGAVLLVFAAAAACSSVVSEAPNLDRLMGAWVLQGSDPDGVQRVYARQDSLCGEQNGYAFGSDGVLLVRNAGWCLTPPSPSSGRSLPAHSGTSYSRHMSEYGLDFRLAVSCSRVEPLARIEAASAPPGIRT